MGKWLYINLAAVLISIVYMYLHFNNVYDPGWLAYMLATLFWIVLFGSGYYIYVYRLGRSLPSKTGSSALAGKPADTRPKVSLKKERPKVVIRKNEKPRNDK